MENISPRLKRKEIQRQLRAWGRFWSNYEHGTGFASVSVTGRCMDILKTGVYISSSKVLFIHQADAVYVPFEIAQMDQAIAQLSVAHRLVIIRFYRRGLPVNPRSLMMAELNILS